MTTPNLSERVTEIVAAYFNVEKDTVTPTTTLTGDLGGDFLSLAEVAMSLEG